MIWLRVIDTNIEGLLLQAHHHNAWHSPAEPVECEELGKFESSDLAARSIAICHALILLDRSARYVVRLEINLHVLSKS